MSMSRKNSGKQPNENGNAQPASPPISASPQRLVNPQGSGRKKPKIGIVGHSRAGKTTFLAVLQAALQAAKWNVSFEAPFGSSSEIVEQYRRSRDYVNNLILWTSKGFFPPPTPIEEEPNYVCCVVSRGDKSFELEFYDPAGQVFSAYGNKSHPELCENIAESLKQCDGVAALFDIDANDSMDSFNQTLRYLHKNPRGKHKGPKFALCLAKSDGSFLQRRFRIRNARAWVEKNRPNWKEMCQSVGLEYACFFVSAVGWNLGTSNIRYFIDSEPLDFDANNILGAVDPNVLQIPDPAVSKAYMRSPDARNNPVDINNEMRNFPAFTNPLQLVEHDFESNPIYDSGPKALNFDAQKNFSENVRVRGVHVGFGLTDPTRRVQQRAGVGGNEGVYRPWNIAQPILWLADMIPMGEVE